MPNNLFKKIETIIDEEFRNIQQPKIEKNNLNTIKLNFTKINYGYDGTNIQNSIEEDDK